MQTRPLISVIIPVYNRASLCVQALESVLAQTYSPLECIIVDGGSTDNIQTTIQPVLAHASIPIQFIHRPTCTGVSHARFIGACHANGTILAFLDADDLWLSHKLTMQYERMSNENTLVCHTKEYWIRHEKPVKQPPFYYEPAGFIFENTLHKCIIGPSTTLIYRNLFLHLGGFPAQLEIAEDYALWILVCARHMVSYCETPLIYKRHGYGDHLSDKYGHIELFRIIALVHLLLCHSSYFTREQIIQLRTTVTRKSKIYANGCRKRMRLVEAELFEHANPLCIARFTARQGLYRPFYTNAHTELSNTAHTKL